MENKNTIVQIIISAAVGLLVGFLIWGNCCNKGTMMSGQGAHMMPDGTMMGGSMDMAAMMASMNANLEGKTGDAFDKAFITEMVMHHEGAVEMAELALTNAKRQEIKDLAKAIIAAQNTEIGQMKAWATAWYSK